MRTRPRPSFGGLGRPRGGRTADPKRSTGFRAVGLIGLAAGFAGLVALAAVASSCLPVGKAVTSTYASLPAEDAAAQDPGPTSSVSVVPAAATRGVISAAGFETALNSPGIRNASGPALADSSTEQVAADKQATLSPPETTPHRVWLVADNQQATQLAALGYQTGEPVIVATGDLRALPFEAREMISYASEVKMGPGLGEEAVWQLEVIRRGHQIPGGGLLMFEAGFDRRLVALYGHPSSSGLGALGEQGRDAGIERLRPIAVSYGADGSVVLPTFEIIATVASAGAGGDGDYSAMTARDVIRPWIETAAANNMYVVLDLQPGRTDFLTQAKVYEEFLRLPHVGLALDPEWRLKPHQVHLETGRHRGRGRDQPSRGMVGRCGPGKRPTPEVADHPPVQIVHDHQPTTHRNSSRTGGTDPNGRPGLHESQVPRLGCLHQPARRRPVPLGLEELLRRRLHQRHPRTDTGTHPHSRVRILPIRPTAALNASPIFGALCDSGLPSFGEPDPEALATGLATLSEAQQRFKEPIGGPRGRIVAAEMLAACQLAEVGLRRLGNQHGLGIEAPTTHEVDKAARAQRNAWLLSNRPGGLNDSIDKLIR